MTSFAELNNREFLDYRKSEDFANKFNSEGKKWFHELKTRFESKCFEKEDFDDSDQFYLHFCYIHFDGKFSPSFREAAAQMNFTW